MTEEVNDVSVSAEESVQTDTPVEQTTDVESSTTEQTDEQVTEEVATSEDNEQTEEQTQQGEEEVADSSQADNEELAPKSQNRFQKLANENRALKQRLAELEELKIPTEQDYLDGGYDPTEAKLNALQAQFQQKEAIDNINSLNSAVNNDMVRVLHEYPELDPNNKEKFNEALALPLFEQYEKDARTRYTEDGIMLETSRLPYEYIKEKMDLIGIASARKSVEAQKNVEKMVAQADAPTSSAPAIKADDSLEAMRERLSNVKF